MSGYIQDLINRMNDRSYRAGEVKKIDIYESSKTVAWLAMDEARGLKDENTLQDLYALLNNNLEESVKQNIYFAIGYITKNTQNHEAIDFLLHSLKKEKESFTLVTILNRLEEIFKPKSIDLKNIVDLNNHRNWHVRCSSYLALTNSELNRETYLAELLSTKEKEDDIVYLLRALGYIGTAKSIPVIESVTKTNYEIKEIVKKTKCSESYLNTIVSRLHLLSRIKPSY